MHVDDKGSVGVVLRAWNGRVWEVNLAVSCKSRATKGREFEAKWEGAAGACLLLTSEQTWKLLGESQVSVVTVSRPACP